MVCTASQLEIKHGGMLSGHIWHHSNGMECKCGEGVQAKNAREG